MTKDGSATAAGRFAHAHAPQWVRTLKERKETARPRQRLCRLRVEGLNQRIVNHVPASRQGLPENPKGRSGGLRLSPRRCRLILAVNQPERPRADRTVDAVRLARVLMAAHVGFARLDRSVRAGRPVEAVLHKKPSEEGLGRQIPIAKAVLSRRVARRMHPRLAFDALMDVTLAQMAIH